MSKNSTLQSTNRLKYLKKFNLNKFMFFLLGNDIMDNSKEIQTLQGLLTASKIKDSLEETIKSFKNPRIDKKKHLQLIQSLFNNDAALVAEFQKQSEVSGNYSALMFVLENYSKTHPEKIKQTKKSISFSNETLQHSPSYSKSTFDTPKISSTKIFVNNSPDNSMLVDFDNIKVSRSTVMWTFNDSQDSTSYKKVSMVGIPISSQETLVVKEVLYCLVGVKGSMIQPQKVTESNTLMQFSVSSELSETLRDLVLEITPLASYYANIQSFVNYAVLPRNGQVLHSLSDALKTIINDYYMSIARLETMHSKQKLSLHKIIYFLRPITIIMEKISEITTQIQVEGIKGKKIIT